MPTLAIAWGFATVVFAGVLYTWLVEDVNVGRLTRDAADSMDGPTYLAAVANLGFALWAIAGAAAVLGASVLRRIDPSGKTWLFMASAGALSFVLLADDMWLLHDRVFPQRVGIPELAVYATYGIMTLAHLYFFRDEIMKTEYVVLLAAASIFGCAMVIDFLTNDAAGTSQKYVTEDIPKFFGMSTWAAYHLRTAYYLIVRRLEAGPERVRDVIATS